MKLISIVFTVLAFSTTTLAYGTSGTTKTQEMEKTPATTATLDIVDTAVGAGQFKTLASALQAADLITTLKGAGPFTVFAPTDAAFAKLPKGTLEKLLKPENKGQLVKILTYHVVPSTILAKDVKAGKAKTVEGKDISISTTGGVTLNGTSKVTTTDINATNGVIHIIDAVILPPGMKL